MRFHLLTVEGAQQFGEAWRIAPSVPLRNLLERGPTLMVPMPGEDIELRFPGGQVMPARIASFGLDAWKDNEGNLYTTTDPSDPVLTLTITSDSNIEAIPSGAEIWLSNARSAPEHGR